MEVSGRYQLLVAGLQMRRHFSQFDGRAPLD